MAKARKITVLPPADLILKAQAASGGNLTETLRAAAYRSMSRCDAFAL